MHQNNVLFSIVVPVYNVENYIEECLNSIVVQAEDMMGLVEVLLIDDGSKDSSGDICDKYADKYPDIIRCFHKQNEGLLLTRRYGYRKAQGEYIINCDSDDCLEMDALQILRDCVEKFSKPDMIIINYALYEEGSKRPLFENLFSNEFASVVDKQAVLKYFFEYNNVVSICTKVCKRSCYEVDKDYSHYAWISNGEDSLQSLELFDRSNSYVYLNKALYNYRTGSGMTSKFDPKYLSSFMAVAGAIECHRETWNLSDFDEYLAIKVLTCTGRAITQSRLNAWKTTAEHLDYLKGIRNIQTLEVYLKRYSKAKNRLQFSYRVVLPLFINKHLIMICSLLRFYNLIGKRKVLSEI